MAMTELKPLTTFNFFVELDGVNIGFFRECSGVDSETEIIEHKEVSSQGKMMIRKVPGAMKWADITLKKSVDAGKELWDWRKQVEQGSVDQARRNGSVVLVGHDGAEVARWNFQMGWPSKWKGADLNAGENNVAIEEITITHEGLERA